MAEEKRTCENCRYDHSIRGCEPCTSCDSNLSNWEMIGIGEEPEKKLYIVKVILREPDGDGIEAPEFPKAVDFGFDNGGIFHVRVVTGKICLFPTDVIHHVLVIPDEKEG